jgi:hypothetical protein
MGESSGVAGSCERSVHGRGVSRERAWPLAPSRLLVFLANAASDWLRDNFEDASWAARCKHTMVHLRDEGVFVSTGVIQYGFAEVGQKREA